MNSPSRPRTTATYCLTWHSGRYRPLTAGARSGPGPSTTAPRTSWACAGPASDPAASAGTAASCRRLRSLGPVGHGQPPLAVPRGELAVVGAEHLPGDQAAAPPPDVLAPVGEEPDPAEHIPGRVV